MRFTQEQLQSFFGENVDVSTLPAAITGSNTTETSIITIFLIMLAIIFMINITKLAVKKIVESKDIDNFSSSRELMLYSSNQNEDKKTNHKQNIYNKYYFNVYIKQPYDKYGTKDTKNKYQNSTYTNQNTNDDFIDVEIVS
ncbi:hypothetical protein [Mucispirillum schaedleri]|uniref:hypothetical protein n=1 Tax=Mucispirillum schaedleri TaxID=248039 RepID=UPI001F59350F|nr:hypothetical protein [Mucispirillum schaedleri]